MPAQVRRDHVRERHHSQSRVRLRRPEGEAAAAQLVQLPGDTNRARLQVDIAAAQRRQFPPSQTAESSQQDECAVPLIDRLSECEYLRKRERRPLWGLL